MSIKIIEYYDPPKDVIEFISEPFKTKYSGSYFALCRFDNGNVLISENKDFKTMGLAQNWVAKQINIKYK